MSIVGHSTGRMGLGGGGRDAVPFWLPTWHNVSVGVVLGLVLGPAPLRQLIKMGSHIIHGSQKVTSQEVVSKFVGSKNC